MDNSPRSISTLNPYAISRWFGRHPPERTPDMAVDKAVLQQLIDEIPFTKAEDKAYFTNALLADESAATQFIGQRLRHNDYTKKTTDLSVKEKDLAAQANRSVQTYATQLQE